MLVQSFAFGALTALAAGLWGGFLTQWQTPARLGDPDDAETIHKFLRYVEVYGSLTVGSIVFITGVLGWMLGDLVARGLRGIQALPVQVFSAVGRPIYRMLEDEEAPLLAAES